MPQTKYIGWVPQPDTIKRIGRIHTLLYRATFGIIGQRMDGLDVLLLTTIGKQSGRARCVPLPYFRDRDRYLLVASFGGNPKNPAWLANIAAEPRVRVQLGARRWEAHASIAQADERERLWRDITTEYPRYANYQTKTARAIPVVVLARADSR
ncbi:MAG TPA: nitroreductase family deazaflavin-dependent oxidoreductase [Polyangiales bacterium]|jgi:deazaflavin-dependent oxidoreductase (nitroreductase family)|nr:nitroreductase family deazaflavin-dependent oxidoreductase [Polyangiales bacterium]